jgi:hypothetical protein
VGRRAVGEADGAPAGSAGHVVERAKGMLTTDQFTALAHKALGVD